MIEIKNVHKKFGQQKVLKGINIQIPLGGIYAVLGPNGSGKTTLIKCLLEMVIPDKGTIEINGENIRKKADYRREIDYLPQIANFPGNLRVKELIKMIKDIRGKEGNEIPLIKTFGLEPFLDKKLAHLSGGTKQKVNLVLCFMFDSPLIILDEPTSGLDPLALVQLKTLIQQAKDNGKTILITSHIMSFVEQMAEKILFILEGEIYFNGNKEDLLKQTQAPDFERAIAYILEKENV